MWFGFVLQKGKMQEDFKWREWMNSLRLQAWERDTIVQRKERWCGASPTKKQRKSLEEEEEEKNIIKTISIIIGHFLGLSPGQLKLASRTSTTLCEAPPVHRYLLNNFLNPVWR